MGNNQRNQLTSLIEFNLRLNTPRWVQFKKTRKIIYRETIDGVEHRFPPLHYFWPHLKRPEELKRLKAWHATMVDKYANDPSLRYYPEEELLTYCR